MNTWMLSANGKVYDHASSFATNGFIDWTQKVNYNIGDIVYIYCTKPIMRVMYKCEVLKCNMPFSECTDDEKFWLDREKYKKSQDGNYARLKLLEQVDTERLSLVELIMHGLKAAPMGPITVLPELNAYIEQHFNDFYTEGFFHDVDVQTQYHEGHVKSVIVDKYERSSIARRKCIEHHGSSCSICGFDFGKTYKGLGEGFIHVHHLKPLHTIREDYVVDYENDLIPVCPNCHAMIHRIPKGEEMNVSQIKEFLLRCQMRNTSAIQQPSTPVDTITPGYDSKPQELRKTYIKRRVRHTSPKFGSGLIKSETDTMVMISFENGITATFTKESFDKGFLVFED